MERSSDRKQAVAEGLLKGGGFFSIDYLNYSAALALSVR